jgi:hypothetical protein
MAVQSIVAWGIILLTILIASVICSRPGDRPGWIIAAGLVLLGSILALWLAPEWAGALAAVLFALLIAAPSTLMGRANLAAHRGQWQRAARLRRWAALLHPTPWTRFLAAVNADGPTGYVAALTRIEASGSRKQRAIARLMLAYERRDWNDVIRLSRAGDAPFISVAAVEMRALGELGRLDEMVQAYGKAARCLTPGARITCMLWVLALTGRVERVKQVLAHRLLAAMDEDSRTYWMAVARLRRNVHDWAALAVLRGLTETGTPEHIRRIADWQLQQASQDTPVSLSLSEDSARTLNDMGPDGQLQPWRRLSPPPPPAWRWDWRWLGVVLLLIAILAGLKRYLGR